MELLLLLTVITRAVWDTIQIEMFRKPINYVLQNAVTAVIAIGMIVLVLVNKRAPVDDPWLWFRLLILQGGIYIALFDYTLNWMRRKPILSYYGDPLDEENQSFLEKWVLLRLPWKFLLAAKALILLGALYIYF